MPLSNLNNDHFKNEIKDEMLQAWDVIMKHLNAFTRNLSPEERTKFGSINEDNKLVVEKVLEYQRNQPHLSSTDIDFEEMKADWSDRQFLAGFVSRMLEATVISNNIRITHDYDAFQAALLDYKYTKYKMDTQPGAGYEKKYKDLLYFFKGNTPKEENDSDKKDESNSDTSNKPSDN